MSVTLSSKAVIRNSRTTVSLNSLICLLVLAFFAVSDARADEWNNNMPNGYCASNLGSGDSRCPQYWNK